MQKPIYKLKESDDTALYWEKYYANNKILPPSMFAIFVQEMLSISTSILELGCGDGRDAIFFAENGHLVTAVDRSHEAIKKLSELKLLNAVQADFSELVSVINHSYDIVYSRFSLHAVDEKLARTTLEFSEKVLRTDGRIFIECRSTQDEMYGVGEKINEDTYFNTHFRRFIKMEDLKQELINLGMKIEFAAVDSNFAPHKDVNPIVNRIIARKIS